MKNFDAWNGLKKIQDAKDRLAQPIFCRERDISWISLGLNIGDEEDGKGDFFERPVLVVKKFNNNLF
jgi:mRNA interferase MazF